MTEKLTQHKRTTLGILGLVAIAAEQGVTIIEKAHHDKRPSFITHGNQSDLTIYALPGCRTDGRHMANMIGPSLSNYGKFIGTVYPENGFSAAGIQAGLLEHSDKASKKAIYAVSMGGLVVGELLRSESFIKAFGHIDSLILDSSPSSIHDIRPLHRALIETASIARFSSLGTKIVKGVMTHTNYMQSPEHEPTVDDNLVHLHHKSSARTPLHVIGSQHDFMYRSHIPPRSLAGLVDNIYYVQSPHDSVINTDQAYINYCKMFDQTIDLVVDTSRPYGSHASGPEFPSKIMELLAPKEQSQAA